MTRFLASCVFLVLLVLNQLYLTTSFDNSIVDKDTWIGSPIVIKPDGSVVPPDAPIVTYDNVTYYITKNLVIEGYAQIIIWKNNTVLDGNNYKLTCKERGIGVYVDRNLRNITVRNLRIANCRVGVYFYINENVTAENIHAGELTRIGIEVFLTRNSVLINNTIRCYSYGLSILYSNNTIASNNTIVACASYGIKISGSENVTVRNNVIAYSYIGVELLENSRNNVFILNDFIENTIQVELEKAGENTWAGNYWSDHDCVDRDRDNVCENKYVIREPDNVDYQPFRNPVNKELVDKLVKQILPEIGITPTFTQTTSIELGQTLILVITGVAVAVALAIVIVWRKKIAKLFRKTT